MSPALFSDRINKAMPPTSMTSQKRLVITRRVFVFFDMADSSMVMLDETRLGFAGGSIPRL